ncbi:hypothetical protein [Pseudomonas mosselii]|uniref:hypothetical protein n=1 Tax=Pseudomonas mosselii TaxID=78327 RepID=UPI001F48EFBB|nr:hypothetical protein [Pseudomonas mosselii]
MSEQKQYLQGEVDRLRAENDRLLKGFYQQVTDADLKEIAEFISDGDLPTKSFFLRPDAANLANVTMHMVREVQALRAQLAERDALLRDFCGHSALICGDLLRLAREDDFATTDPIRTRAYSAMDHARKVKKTLSASAEPSAPSLVECDGCPRSSGCVGSCMKVSP